MNESAQQVARTYASVNLTESDTARFWANVDKSNPNGCWPWKACVATTGYGKININGKSESCHRVSLHLAGHDITKGQALHHCDNRRCVNPAHLYLGDYQNNADDREERNPCAQARGEAAGKAKLTEAQVREIRIRHAAGGIDQPALGVEYGVSAHQICMIVLRRNWKHVV